MLQTHVSSGYILRSGNETTLAQHVTKEGIESQNFVKMLLRRILCITLVCICYFAIVPLALDTPNARQWAQFVDFMTRYNKSYQNNSAVVLQRFKVFQVAE